VELPTTRDEAPAAQARQEWRAGAAQMVEDILDGISLREHDGQARAELTVRRGEVRQLTRPPPGVLAVPDVPAGTN
jgi:hypothetical protein